MAGPIAAEIERRLTAEFAPEQLTVRDDSHRHAGHGGYREGVETHLHIMMIAACFAGQSRLARQRAVLAQLADLMENPVHALSMELSPPAG